MRIAIAGKGGSGKTTLAGTLARLLARRGRAVLAVDGDTNPNLAQTLGLPAESDLERAVLSSDLLVRREGENGAAWTELALPVEQVLHRHAAAGPDGLRLLIMGRVEHAGAGCKCRAHSIVRSLLGELLAVNGAASDVVVDMEAGLEHLSRGTTRHVDVVLAVAEPYFRSLETARRVAELAGELGIGRVELLANKLRGPADAEAIRGYAAQHGLRVAAEVPFDESIVQSERRRAALLDSAGAAAPSAQVLDRLADVLVGPSQTGAQPWPQ